jgi:hypothetical protein
MRAPLYRVGQYLNVRNNETEGWKARDSFEVSSIENTEQGYLYFSDKNEYGVLEDDVYFSGCGASNLTPALQKLGWVNLGDIETGEWFECLDKAEPGTSPSWKHCNFYKKGNELLHPFNHNQCEAYIFGEVLCLIVVPPLVRKISQPSEDIINSYKDSSGYKEYLQTLASGSGSNLQYESISSQVRKSPLYKLL